MAELVVVGCGTVVPEGDRAASCFYLSEPGSGILIDCGPGAVQALARLGVEWGALTDLAITHFHADHVGALPGLFFALTHGLPAPRRDPLDIWGPLGTVALFDGLAATLGEFMRDPGFEVRIHEVRPDTAFRTGAGIRVGTHKTPHTEESLAYRFDGRFGAVGFSGDTGPSRTLGTFMEGVDVLVCECSLRDREVGDNHLSPTSVARIAAAARPGVVVLTHIYPHFRLSDDVIDLVARAGYAGDVRIAVEGMRVPVRGSGDAPER